MDPPGDRLEVGQVERVRIKAAVPADDVERMLGMHDDGACHSASSRAGAAVFHKHLDVRRLDARRRAGAAQVALAVGRMLEELPACGQITLGRGDVGVGLDRVGAQGLGPIGGGPGRHPAVRSSARDQDVVPTRRLERPEHGLHRRRAALDVHALVADRVAVQRRGRAGDRVGDPDVAVAEHEPAPGHGVGAGPVPVEAVQAQVPRPQWVVRRRAQVGQVPGAAVDDRRRDTRVVEQRGVRGEALGPHQFLVVERAVGTAELRVPLGRDLPRHPVIGHGPILPRAAAAAPA